ncbi:MAG TPA: serine hydrolase domain-containing protein, partial [Burkholderiales bacterium]
MNTNRDRRPIWAALLFLMLAALAPIAVPAAGEGRLDWLLKDYAARYKLPALAAAVVQGGNIVASGAVGQRRADLDAGERDNAVTLSDRFHLGSDTKAMTALMAGIMTEKKWLRWDSTVAEVFPELVPTMDDGVGTITLEQLLSHSGGIPGDSEAQWALVRALDDQDGNLDDLRYMLVQGLVRQPLQSPPGKKFAYSNMGYTLAGAMLERVTRDRKVPASWEELISLWVFDGLGLKTAGLGPQASLGRLDAPLGHRPRPLDGKPKVMLPGPRGDNPELIGPAGTAHMSVLDFAAWAGWNAGEGRRGPKLASAETLIKLHTPVIDIPPDMKLPAGARYALGWGVIKPGFSDEPFLFHAGSNGMNSAQIYVQPKSDFAMVLMTNRGG